MAVTMQEVKDNLRIDHDFDDDLIKRFLNAAEKYIKDSVTLSPNREPYFADNALYDLGVILLASHYYESRLAATEKEVKEIPYGVTSFITQLEAAYMEEG